MRLSVKLDYCTPRAVACCGSAGCLAVVCIMEVSFYTADTRKYSIFSTYGGSEVVLALRYAKGMIAVGAADDIRRCRKFTLG